MNGVKRRWLAIFGSAAAAAILAGIYLWQASNKTNLPEGLVVGNGRIEGTEIKVAAKYPGRIIEVTAGEGDDIEKGKIIVRLDNREAVARLKQARAEHVRVEHVVHSTKADIERRRKELTYAKAQLNRTRQLFERGTASQQQLDRDSTAMSTAAAALQAAQAAKMQSEAQLVSANAQIDRYVAIVSEMEIRAPISGRVLFRIAEPGEIIQAGGNVLLLVDLNRLYMTLYVSEVSAGRISIGDEALIWTDAYPNKPFPAKVTFISSKAEFTPKEVQTSEERQNLVFQVKITALQNSEKLLKPGMPGIGLIRISGDIPWPKTAPNL
jgi:HlyD family secretion protein